MHSLNATSIFSLALILASLPTTHQQVTITTTSTSSPTSLMYMPTPAPDAFTSLMGDICSVITRDLSITLAPKTTTMTVTVTANTNPGSSASASSATSETFTNSGPAWECKDVVSATGCVGSSSPVPAPTISDISITLSSALSPSASSASAVSTQFAAGDSAFPSTSTTVFSTKSTTASSTLNPFSFYSEPTPSGPWRSSLTSTSTSTSSSAPLLTFATKNGHTSSLSFNNSSIPASSTPSNSSTWAVASTSMNKNVVTLTISLPTSSFTPMVTLTSTVSLSSSNSSSPATSSATPEGKSVSIKNNEGARGVVGWREWVVVCGVVGVVLGW